jgi:hypothetical protein
MEQVASTVTWTKGGHYVWAVLFPIAGAILAVRAWSKSEFGPGFALMTTSTLAFALWYVLLDVQGY